MLCPECNHALQSITLKPATGDTVVDYCASCGGTWTDHGEVNFLHAKDIGPLQMVLPKDPVHPAIQHNLCPRDRSILQIFKAESVPIDLAVYQCPICNGMWFPNKNLITLKNAQEVKINYFKTWNIPLHSIYAILLPLLVLSLVSAGLLATIYGVRQGQDVRTRAKDPISQPYVLHPTPQQAAISFTTEKASQSKIIYWFRPDETYQRDISTVPETTHTIVLDDLELNRTYSYQIIITAPEYIESAVFTFDTKNPF